MTGLLEQGSRQGQEESGQQKHPSVDQAEIMLHLRNIIENTIFGRQGVEMSHFQQTRGLDEKEPVRAGVNLGGTVEEKPIQDIVHHVVSI